MLLKLPKVSSSTRLIVGAIWLRSLRRSEDSAILQVWILNAQRNQGSKNSQTNFSAFALRGYTREAAIRPNRGPETSAIATPCSKRNWLGLTEAFSCGPGAQGGRMPSAGKSTLQILESWCRVRWLHRSAATTRRRASGVFI